MILCNFLYIFYYVLYNLRFLTYFVFPELGDNGNMILSLILLEWCVLKILDKLGFVELAKESNSEQMVGHEGAQLPKQQPLLGQQSTKYLELQSV